MSNDSQDFKDAVSRGFSAGNFAECYVSRNLETALEQEERADQNPDFRAAFILGFFSSYSLEEIPVSAREEYDNAYFSEAGLQAIAVGYFESRADEYDAEQKESAD